MNRLAYRPSSRDRLPRRLVTPKSNEGGSLGAGGSFRARRRRLADSSPLSRSEYAEILRIERRRALYLAIAILCLLVVALCLYFTRN